MKSLFFNLLFLTICSIFTVSANNTTDPEKTFTTEPKNNENIEAVNVNLNFNVLKRDGKADFFWTTPFLGTAQNFIVQFSEDGKKFYDISVVETDKVEVGDIFYDFYFVPFNIKNYYRIKLVNNDGSISYTKTVLK